MAINRYSLYKSFPQPIREIAPSPTDLIHVLSMGERLDNLAQKYYGDPMLVWVIMCANPEYANEFEIPFGKKVRIPYPLERVTSIWNLGKIN